MKPSSGSTDEKVLKADFPCRMRSLNRVRARIHRFAVSHGYEPEAEEIVLATQEALKNVVQHARPEDGSMHVECTALPDRMVVEVADAGCGFDVKALDEHPSSPMDVHGRGIQLMKGLMDSVEIDSGESGTRVRMTKIRK